jgi:thermitase
LNRLIRAALMAGLSALALAPAASAAGIAPNQVIVKYAPGSSQAAREAVTQAAGVTGRLGTITANGAQVLRVAGDARAAAALMNRSAAVQYAEPNVILEALAIPNDPRFGELYGIHNTGQSAGKADADLDGPEGWDLAALGAFPATGGVKVGIVDTGIDATHPDLAGRLADCASTGAPIGVIATDNTVSESRGCTDDNDHGTHVSGTIAAVANNGIGVAGVAFNSTLSHCKALFGVLGMGTTAAVANCITYLKNKGVKVISMSLGGGSSTTLQSAVQGAWNGGNGAIVIAAAGNDGDGTLNYPAAYPEVVSVAATDRNDQRASFSNANSDVEIAAAGVSVLSTVRGGTYKTLSGTSMATPHVAGAAALIRFKNPAFTAQQTRDKLDAGVDDLGTPGRDPQYGFGRVTLSKALG